MTLPLPQGNTGSEGHENDTLPKVLVVFQQEGILTVHLTPALQTFTVTIALSYYRSQLWLVIRFKHIIRVDFQQESIHAITCVAIYGMYIPTELFISFRIDLSVNGGG